VDFTQIIHISDTHLGCAQFDSEEREQDVYEAFQEVVDAAVKDKVDAVVHAGDIFHYPKPGGRPLVKMGEALKTLSENGIATFFTLGEHDISRITGTPSPYLFHKLGLATYVGTGEPVTLGDLKIIGFNKYRRGEVDELVEELKAAGTKAKGHSGKKLLVLHQGLLEFHKFAGELTAKDLPPEFDYYAFGHLHDNFHRHFEDMQGPVCYPGSLDPTPGEGIKEYKKGYYFVDLSGAEANPQWVQLTSSRRMCHYDLEYESMMEGVGKIAKELEANPTSKKPVLSVTISGVEVDPARMTAALARLAPFCLACVPTVREQSQSLDRVYDEKPADIANEMLSLAENALGSKELASFAVDELLPLLQGGQTDEALSLVEEAFEKSRFGVSKP
jgi:DNA repair protein SbcD/Mre11